MIPAITVTTKKTFLQKTTATTMMTMTTALPIRMPGRASSMR